MSADRRAYQRLWQRHYRAQGRAPRELVAVAGPDGRISLTKAGIIPGRSYLATPQPKGAILLSLIPVEGEA